MHLLPRLPHHAARRGHRLRPARAGGQVQEDGGDGHAPGDAQKLRRSASPREKKNNTRFFNLANWIRRIFWAHYAFLFLIGRRNFFFNLKIIKYTRILYSFVQSYVTRLL